jgi:bifunctional DNA-binding transcriptional regulator/antitoxin component of YhaV-PrlF toxin-antitoxin module
MPKQVLNPLDMSLVKLRGAAQITLPLGIRKTLKVRTGDYLEAELTGGGVFLKPVVVMHRSAMLARIIKSLHVQKAKKGKIRRIGKVKVKVKTGRKTSARRSRRK